MRDTSPLPRTLRIGRIQVGLVHLDTALAKVLSLPDLTEDEAVARLYSSIAPHNYIPPQAEAGYRDALRREWRRHKGLAVTDAPALTIRILGPGCVSCNAIATTLIEILQRLGLAADIEQVKDLDEIWRHGVLTTPALVINGEVKSAGRRPTPAEIEAWVRDAADGSPVQSGQTGG